jgi:hypothetical protein
VVRTRLAPFAFALALVGLAACDNDPERIQDLGPITPSDPIPATNYIDAVARDGGSGMYVDEEMPIGDATAPELDGSLWFVRGGSMVLNVTVEDTATELYVSATRADLGYYRVPLDGSAVVIDEERTRASARVEKLAAAGVEPAAREVTAFRAPRTVTLTLTPAETASSFTVTVAASDGASVSSASTHGVQVNTTAGSSAELQVSLNWIDGIDYDLHLVTPSGQTIYYAQKDGPNGGRLDLDSNPGCNLDWVNNENITWGSTTPAPGEYVVELDVFSACSEPGPFPYLITVTVDGESTIFEGEMALVGGSPPPALEVTRFTVAP